MSFPANCCLPCVAVAKQGLLKAESSLMKEEYWRE